MPVEKLVAGEDVPVGKTQVVELRGVKVCVESDDGPGVLCLSEVEMKGVGVLK